MTTQASKALKVLPNDLIDELLAGYQKPEDLIGENGLLKQLTKALVERALQAEMTEHLGHDKHTTVNKTNKWGQTRYLARSQGQKKWGHLASVDTVINCKPFYTIPHRKAC